MGLSQDLILKFAKVIQDSKKISKDAVVYGTVKTDDIGNKYVQLDGSDQLTPVADENRPNVDTATAMAKNGDRVSVLISNHTATITGNISSPAVREGDFNEVKDDVSEIKEFDIVIADKVQANEAYFKKLIADDAILNKLEAANISVTQLIAKQADIDALIAGTITVEQLIAKQVDTDILEANYATIDSLSATTADIGSLKTDVGNISTLMFGDAGGQTIQANFANAIIATLGEAWIGEAMVGELDASSIKSGSIDTSNVKIESESGKLVIADNTIQISDDNQVRVQIGKDSSNDYSINVWDSEGHLMFSKGGITDAAIKNAIIRDDMISDNAGINAAKLDIQSLFTQINESGETINSSKIFLDDKEQLLSVAFDQLDRAVADNANTISAHGSAINVLNDKISTKVWQEDIDSASSELNTKYSQLEQTVDTFTTQVSDVNVRASNLESRMSSSETLMSQTADQLEFRASKTEVTQAIDDVKIGAKNLLLNSDLADNFDEWNAKDIVNGYTTREGTYIYADTSANVGSNIECICFGKNVLKLPPIDSIPIENYSSSDIGSINTSVDDDGAIHIVGLLPENTTYINCNIFMPTDSIVIPGNWGGKSVTFSQSITGLPDDASLYLTFSTQDYEGFMTLDDIYDTRDPYAHDSIVIINFTCSVIGLTPGEPVDITVYPQLENSSYATPYVKPIVDFSKACKSTNLLTYPYVETTKTENGITFTDNGDGTITVNGTATKDVRFILNSGVSIKKDMYISGVPISYEDVPYEICAKTSVSRYISTLISQRPVSNFDFINTTSVDIRIKTGCVANNLTFKPKLELGTAPTDYEINNGSLLPVKITQLGKNLFAENKITSCVKVSDQSFGDTLGKATGQYLVSSYGSNGGGTYWRGHQMHLPAGVYNISTDCYFTKGTISSKKIRLGVTDSYGTNIYQAECSITEYDTWQRINATITVEVSGYYNLKAQPVGDSSKYNGMDVRFKNIQVEVGDTSSEYAPYVQNVGFADSNGVIANLPEIDNGMWLFSNAEDLVLISATYCSERCHTKKNGEDCCLINHDSLGQTKVLSQSIINKLEPYTEYILSLWVLTEDISYTDSSALSLYTDGYYPVDNTPTWFSYGTVALPRNSGSGTWERVVLPFKTDDKILTADSYDIFIYTSNLFGKIYVRDIQLEKGNKITDWTPAPEDLATTKDLAAVITQSESSLALTTEKITASVMSLKATYEEQANVIQSIQKSVSSTMSADDIRFEISQIKTDGVTRVDTQTGFVFDEFGFQVSKEGFDTKTNISENGMNITSLNTPDHDIVLTANKDGVDAKNLKATTYLNVGDIGRFEKFTNANNEIRMACFWIGGVD